VFSVNYTDAATYWLVCRAQWNKGQEATRDSLEDIRDITPGPLLSVHPDTGGEFINWNMKEWCESQGVQFKFMLQTNGYLMTADCIDQYLKIGLDQVRISVDGDAGVHDRNRPLRGGGGTFQRIMENIVVSVDKVKIGISSGYEKSNILDPPSINP